MTGIKGSVALVTGGAGGIGSAIASALATSGATVVRTDLAGADVALDVTDAAAVSAAVGAVVREHGRIDIVVTAAGLGVAGAIESVSGDEWQRVVDVNLWGTVHMVRAVYPRMVEQRHGHVLFVASLSGLLGTPLLTPYAMTKHAVVGIGRSLRAEASRYGIGVGSLCPGPVDTRLLHDGGVGGGSHGVDIRRYLTSAAGPALAPEKIGTAAVRAIERNRAITAPGLARWLDLGARLSPGVAERIVARAMRKELARATTR